MKKLLLFIVFVAVTIGMLVAQTPQMTYQAVIRDINGQLLTSHSVQATVTIKVGESKLFTQTYTETTNVHGLLTVTFGDAGFATIDWANASISCEVYNGTDVYIAENFQPVTAVPLAIKAITESDPQFNASVASDITSADTLYWNHKLDAEVDGSVTNELQVLSISKDTIYLSNGGFVKLPAVIDTTSLDDAYNNGSTITADAGPVTINGTDGFLATGTFNSGTLPVSGAGTRMMWYPRNAAFRTGYVDGTQWDNANIGYYSTATGYNTSASGYISTAMGNGTTASYHYSTAMGNETMASGQASTAMGMATIASGNISTAMGMATIASGEQSTTMGFATKAEALRSTAMGSGTMAKGEASTAMGYSTTASGSSSTAMGRFTSASATYSTAMGESTTASGKSSTSMGYKTVAQPYASVVLGRYNVIAGDSLNWQSADPLFVIGNGETSLSPSNALTVYKNGNMDVNGVVTASGGNSTNWNTAYGWGDHSTAGYLTSFTEVDGSVTNEIQTLSLSGNDLSISGTGGNTVTLPAADGSETKLSAGSNITVTGTGTNADPYVVNQVSGTTPGEMQYWNGSAWVTVAAGKNGQILKFKNGVPTWKDGNINDLEIGDSYGGGIITYFLQPGDPGYDTNVRHGIIAAPSDQSTGAEWGCWGTMISATSVLILTGAANTNAIVAGCSEIGAAKLCDDLSLNTYSDWYLPSLYELGLMFTNLHTQGLGDFDEGTSYWSSSENGNYYAWSFKFSNVEYCALKYYSYSVRAVRSF